MNDIKIIIYGTGALARELYKQIQCYNQIMENEMIRILAYTETRYCLDRLINNIPVIPLEKCADYGAQKIVIASRQKKEIQEHIERLNIIDSKLVVTKEDFSPKENGLNLSQIINSYAYEQGWVGSTNKEEKKLYQQYTNNQYFIDVFGRRRFIENQDSIDDILTEVPVFRDDDLKLKYVLYDNKRLYYPNNWTDSMIQEYHAFNVWTCKNNKSAHQYLTEDFSINQDDVVADIGGAEGLFALDIIDKVSKVYIFEVDETWIGPLRATFRPFENKVTIVNQFVSNVNYLNKVTLDSYFKNKVINFIKMDIEGEEQKALLGSSELLKRNDVKWAVTTYHKSEDAEFIEAFFMMKGYTTEKSEGYLWIDFESLGIDSFGEFRKAMLRAYKR